MSIQGEETQFDALVSPIHNKRDSFNFLSFNETGKRPRRNQRMSLAIPNQEKTGNFSSTIDAVYLKQQKLIERFRRNETKYAEALSRIASNLADIKRKTSFLKVENGQTVDEYLRFRQINEDRDHEKRRNCLQLLNLVSGSNSSQPIIDSETTESKYKRANFACKVTQSNRRGGLNHLQSNLFPVVFSQSREVNRLARF